MYRTMIENNKSLKNEINSYPYNKLYVDEAAENMAFAFDYAYNGMNMSIKEFSEKLLNFEYIHLLENGNPKFIAGKSGTELARLICDKEDEPVVDCIYEPKAAFWIGMIVAYYQWSRNTTYKEIFTNIMPEEFEKMYHIQHERSIESVLENIDQMIKRNKEKNEN